VDTYYEYLRTFSLESWGHVSSKCIRRCKGQTILCLPLIKTLLRQPLPAQALTISGVSKHLRRRDRRSSLGMRNR